MLTASDPCGWTDRSSFSSLQNACALSNSRDAATSVQRWLLMMAPGILLRNRGTAHDSNAQCER